MATELARPGVEVIQQFQSAAPTIVTPTLVPFVCGPAKEVVEVTTSDGLLNAKAKQGTYTQLPKVISQSAFPSPRSNITEVNVEEASVKAFFNFGGQLHQLDRNPGSSFLTSWNKASKAALDTIAQPGPGFDLNGKVLTLAIDVPARLDTTKNIVVAFSATGNLSAAQVADQLNTAVGAVVATVLTDSRVRIASTIFGAKSSVTIRAGGSANTTLGFSGTAETRVEGSGFRAQDQNNNTTISPWVEWYRGAYLVDGVDTSFPVEGPGVFGAGLVDGDGTFTGGKAEAITFTGANSIDLRVGDIFFADGVQPNTAAVVAKVEATRFRLGTVNAQLSIYDADGDIVTAVYDQSNINTLFNAAPFAPRYAWFKAENLLVTSPTAAALTGTTAGNAATTASVEGASAPAGPFSLTGLNLIVSVTVNGVVRDDQTFTFTGGPLADMPAVVAAIGSNITGVTPLNNSGRLVLSTALTGAGQSITLKAASTAMSVLGFNAGDHSATGKDVEFVDIGAALLTSGQTFATTALNGMKLSIEISTDGGGTFPTTKEHTFAAEYANITDLVAALNADATFTGAAYADLRAYNQNGQLLIRTTATGSQVAARIAAGCNAIGAGKLAYTAQQSDAGEENLAGQMLKFKLNDRPQVYQVVFGNDSLPDAVASINTAVGWPVASVDSGDDQLVLTSDLLGMASKVEVVNDSTTIRALNALGFGTGNRSASGTGRPNPDFYLDNTGSVVLGADILRQQVTGQPYGPGSADIYIQYTGLRLDVSPLAKKPALLSISDTTTLNTVLGPLNAQNPLGLGMFFSLVNAPGMTTTGLGVDDAPAAAPEGTLAAYTRVANFIESKEVYAIAPLSHDPAVAQMFKNHCSFMSGPSQKGERVVFFNPVVPERAVDTVLASGLNGSTSATSNQFVLDVNPAGAMIAAGLNPALPLSVGDAVFLRITVNGEVRTYNVSGINGVVASLRTTFNVGENTDGFFTTTPLTETLVNADYSFAVRGDLLLIPGSSLPDKDAIASTVATQASAYAFRRFYYVFPDVVNATLDGVNSILPGYYACAALAGMTASFPPQQGFTNLPISGFTGVTGSNDTFSNSQMNVMAGGGAFVLVQDAEGAPVISRHQLSTDLSSIETREYSITKIVDFTAKFLRGGIRHFIGTYNITQPFLDQLSTVIHGMLQFLVENGVLISADLNNIIQDENQPDTVLVDVTLDVPFPCNYIRLTLVI